MELRALREKFVRVTGRYDLADPETFADSGADFYLNRGVRYLDTHAPSQPRPRQALVTTVDGGWLVDVPNLRVLQRAALYQDGRFLPLEVVDQHEVEHCLPLMEPVTEKGRPLYVAMFQEIDFIPLYEYSHQESRVVVAPVPNGRYRLRLEGTFYSPKLEKDEDKNWWTVQYPDLVVQAAWYALEAHYRNTQGMRDHAAYVLDQLQHIDFDRVEQEIVSAGPVRRMW